MLNDCAFATLEAHARAGCHTSAPESRGMCFQATLALGREARRLGLDHDVEFIRWRVLRDVDFLEHWALLIDGGRVLDMTAMQVDGDPQPLRHVADYPGNYVRPSRYPLSLVLGVIDGIEPPSGRNYARATLWTLHRRLFAHEAAAAMRTRSIRRGVDAAAAVVYSGITLSLGYLLERAIARMSRLLMRLD